MHDNTASITYQRDLPRGQAYMRLIEDCQEKGKPFIAVLYSTGYIVARPGALDPVYKVKYQRRDKGVAAEQVAKSYLDTMRSDPGITILDCVRTAKMAWYGMSKATQARLEKQIDRMRNRKSPRRGAFYTGPELYEVARSNGATTVYESYI